MELFPSTKGWTMKFSGLWIFHVLIIALHKLFIIIDFIDRLLFDRLFFIFITMRFLKIRLWAQLSRMQRTLNTSISSLKVPSTKRLMIYFGIFNNLRLLPGKPQTRLSLIPSNKTLRLIQSMFILCAHPEGYKIPSKPSNQLNPPYTTLLSSTKNKYW